MGRCRGEDRRREEHRGRCRKSALTCREGGPKAFGCTCVPHGAYRGPICLHATRWGARRAAGVPFALVATILAEPAILLAQLHPAGRETPSAAFFSPFVPTAHRPIATARRAANSATCDAKPAIRARADTFGAAARSSYGGLKQPKPASCLLSQEVDASPLALPSAEPVPLLTGSAAPSAGGAASSFSACGRTGNVPHWGEGRREEHEAQHDS